MAFDFPASPADGATYSPAGGPAYVYRTATGAWKVNNPPRGWLPGDSILPITTGGTGAGDAPTARTNLGLQIGTNVQAQDPQLQMLAGLAPANGDFTRWTGLTTGVTQPIVGAVAQAAGVPTGAIIEKGSNANGSYVKFADGTMICVFTANFNITTTAVGGIFRDTATVSWTFPAVFAASPDFSQANVSATTCWATASGTSSTLMNATIYSSGALTGTAVTVRFVAIGRWF